MMVKFFRPIRLIIIGIILLLLGFTYSIIFAGLPYQDPSEELYASWKFHHEIASWTMLTGLFLTCLSILIFIGQKFKNLVSKDKI